MNTTTEAFPAQDSIENATALNNAYWRLAQRIAASEYFSKSEFLPRFLLYICDHQLRGMTQEITEQKIGVRVFHRPADYNPGNDNIVRNYAGQLRKRLDLYFEKEGVKEDIRISIPRGGYIPIFEKLHSSQQDTRTPAASIVQELHPLSDEPTSGNDTLSALTPSASDPATSAPRPDWRMFLWGIAACLPLFCALLLYNRFHIASSAAASPFRPLWSEIFSRDRDTYVVPADSGVGILQNLTEQPANLADYISGKYLSDIRARNIDNANLQDLRSQRYSSVADIQIIAKLARVPEIIPDRFVIRFPRDLRMDDLREGNAILLGAIHTDPWVSLLQQQLNFRFVCESHINHCSILNSHPAQGEKAKYENEAEESSHQTFGVVAFMPNMNRTGHILLVEGLNMASTQAGADVLLNDELMRPVIQKAMLANGSIGSFELLVQTTTLDATPLPPQIIASRYEH